MNNLFNEEKMLKKFLKRKMNFSLENLVKFLITGTLAFTVTACGGGGGGGGSSTDVNREPSNVSKIKNDVKKEISDLKDKKIETKEDFKAAFEKLAKDNKVYQDSYTEDEELAKEIMRLRGNIKAALEKDVPNLSKIKDLERKLDLIDSIKEKDDGSDGDDFYNIIDLYRRETKEIKDIDMKKDAEDLNRLIKKIYNVAQKSNESLGSNLSDIGDDLRNLREEKNKRNIEVFLKEITEIYSNLGNLEASYKMNKINQNTSLEKLNKIDEEIQKLDGTDIINLEDIEIEWEISDLRVGQENLEDSIKDFKEQEDDINNEIDEKQTEKLEFENKVKNLKKEKEFYENEIKNLKTKKDKIESEIKNLEIKKSNTQDNNIYYQLEEQIEELKANKEDINYDIEENNREKEYLNEEINREKLNINHLNSEIEELKVQKNNHISSQEGMKKIQKRYTDIMKKMILILEKDNPDNSKIENLQNKFGLITRFRECYTENIDLIRLLNKCENSIEKITVEDIELDKFNQIINEVTELKNKTKDKSTLEKITQILNKLEELKQKYENRNTRSTYSVRSFSAPIVPIEPKKIEDLVPSYLKETAKVWDKLRFEGSTKEQREIINILEKDDFKNIEGKMKDLYPSMYSNLAREISDKNKLFNSKNKLAIDSLKENKYGFILLNELKDVKKYNHITGYKSRQHGFVGSINLENGLYGNIGYAYEDINYKENAKSNIHTLHLGLNKNKTINNVDFNFALSGEYNFHKNTRTMKNFDKTAKSKFNSYSVGVSAGASKKFGDSLYVKPYSEIGLTYIKHKGFVEKNAGIINARINGQTYTSFLPKVGFELGKSFANINLFSNFVYSYEFGNLNKAEKFSYEFEKNTGRKLVQDSLEKGKFMAKVGANYINENFSVGLNLGQDFDKRGNKFVNFNIGYKF